MLTEFWSENLETVWKPRHRWGDNIIMGRKRNLMGRCGLDSTSEWDPVTGFCEHANEPSVKGGEFVE
jgi:hypothetical protein